MCAFVCVCVCVCVCMSVCVGGEYGKLALLDALQIHFQSFFAISFLHSIPNELNEVNINLLTYVDCGSVVNFSVVYLAKAHNHLISSNTTYIEN